MGLGYSRTTQFLSIEKSSLPVAGETSHTRCRQLGLGDVSTNEPTAWTALSRHCAEECLSLLYEGTSSLHRKNVHMSSDQDEFRNITANME